MLIARFLILFFYLPGAWELSSTFQYDGSPSKNGIDPLLYSYLMKDSIWVSKSKITY